MDPFRLMHLEAAEDADLGADGGDADTATADATATAEADAGATTGEEEWSLSRQDFETLQGSVRQLAELVEPLLYEEESDESEDDPFGEDGFDPFNAAHMSALIQQQIAPLAHYIQGEQLEAGNERVQETLAEMAPGLSEPAREVAHVLADAAYIQAGGQQAHVDPRAALQHGIQQVATLVKSEREAAVEEYKQSLVQSVSAPHEVAATGGATEIMDAPEDEAAAALRFIQRQRRA